MFNPPKKKLNLCEWQECLRNGFVWIENEENDTNQKDLVRDGYKLGSHGNKLGIFSKAARLLCKSGSLGLRIESSSSHTQKRLHPELDQVSWSPTQLLSEQALKVSPIQTFG